MLTVLPTDNIKLLISRIPELVKLLLAVKSLAVVTIPVLEIVKLFSNNGVVEPPILWKTDPFISNVLPVDAVKLPLLMKFPPT